MNDGPRGGGLSFVWRVSDLWLDLWDYEVVFF